MVQFNTVPFRQSPRCKPNQFKALQCSLYAVVHVGFIPLLDHIAVSDYAKKAHHIGSIHFYNSHLKGTDVKRLAFCVYVMEQIWYVIGHIQYVMDESILECSSL